jgi:hypothetical protein
MSRRKNKIPSLEKLEEAMRQSGVDPTATRQTMRAEIMKQAVLENEVDAKLFWGYSIEKVREYTKPTKPNSSSLRPSSFQRFS